MNLNDNPLVSVIIPTYKRGEYLPAAISSVLEQTYSPIEILVIDDNGIGTPDGLVIEHLMKEYEGDFRVRYIQHEINQHGGVARNTGIYEARGELITFLDDDDTYRPTKIAKQVDYLKKHSEFQAVYCGWVREKSFVPRLTGDLSYQLLSGDQIILTNAIMIFREAALSCGGFDPRLKRHQEAIFLLRYFANGGKIGALPEVLVDFNLSDRQNQEKDAKTVENYTDYYLTLSQPFISRVVSLNPNLRQKIFVHRYRGNLLSYFKYNDWLGAMSFYIRKGFIFPFYFHKSLFDYLVRRIVK